MRTCVFDIETTDFAAVGAGIVLCVAIRQVPSQQHNVFRIDDYTYKSSEKFGFFEREEKDMLAAVCEELDKYDLLVGHNIKRFDIPYLRSRSWQHGLGWNTRPLVYDTLDGFRKSGFLTRPNGFGKPSASMDMVADFLGLDQLKTKIYPASWWASVWGNKAKRAEAMNEIVDHCQRDVRMNANMYPILLANDPVVNIKRM